MEIEILPDKSSYKWYTKHGTGIYLDKMDDKLFIELYRGLQKLAEMKRQAWIDVYSEFNHRVARDKIDFLSGRDWTSFTEPEFAYFEEEVKRRGLTISNEIVLDERIPIDGLEQFVAGAIKDIIKTYGPIDIGVSGAATKRIVRAIKEYNK